MRHLLWHGLIPHQLRAKTRYLNVECFTRNMASHVSPNSPIIIFSGIQPTGIPHLGNYLGAIRSWVELQYISPNVSSLPVDSALRLYSIVGWHALTFPPNPVGLLRAKFDTAASLLALGIDPKKSVLFYQDDVPEHLELCWILTCLTPIGWLKRMTTWKAKLAIARNSSSEEDIDDTTLNLGLFSYPVLQGADILAYRATHVPVGDDQKQHVELSRNLAETFNRRYIPSSASKQIEFEGFPLPNAIYTPSARILSLRDPSQKMSKSSPDADSRIMFTDTPTEITRKIRAAVTDSTKGISYDPIARPGVTNLLRILAAFRGVTSHDSLGLEKLAMEYADKGTGQFKNDVAEAVVEAWRRPREEMERIKNDRAYVTDVLQKGATKARELSHNTLDWVRNRVGLGVRC